MLERGVSRLWSGRNAKIYLPRGQDVHLYFLRGSVESSSWVEGTAVEMWEGDIVDWAGGE